jgi:polyhydroxybutyrate depolymerase
MSRISLRGRIAFLAVLLVAGGCGGSGPTTIASTTASPSLPSYTYDCRSIAATDTTSPSPAGVTYATMIVDGKYRDYRLYRPPTLDATKPVPLVVVLHGMPIDAAGFEDVLHFQAEASAGGFIAAYPDGCDEDWDQSARSYDVDFVNKMLDQLEGEFQIDQSRVYVVGGSAGAFMAYRLACDIAGRIAAIASVAGSMWWNDCSPARPVPILEMHGTADANVPYDGGRSTYHNNMAMPSVMTVIQRWAALDGCTGSQVTTRIGITTTTLWNRCSGGAVVRLDTVVGGHHTWFGSSFDPVRGEPDSNTVVWSFLKQFQLPV